MTMIKIGHQFVNMDNVTSISTDQSGNAKIEYYADRSVWIYGHEAQALIHWLTCIAPDLIDMYKQDMKEEEAK